MADCTILFNVETFWVEDYFSGQGCSACNDAIYGNGYRLMLAYKTNKDLPNFKETKFLLCNSCKQEIK